MPEYMYKHAGENLTLVVIVKGLFSMVITDHM